MLVLYIFSVSLFSHPTNNQSLQKTLWHHPCKPINLVWKSNKFFKFLRILQETKNTNLNQLLLASCFVWFSVSQFCVFSFVRRKTWKSWVTKSIVEAVDVGGSHSFIDSAIQKQLQRNKMHQLGHKNYWQRELCVPIRGY